MAVFLQTLEYLQGIDLHASVKSPNIIYNMMSLYNCICILGIIYSESLLFTRCLLTILDKVAYNLEVSTVNLVNLLSVIQDSLVVIATTSSYGHVALKLSCSMIFSR